MIENAADVAGRMPIAEPTRMATPTATKPTSREIAPRRSAVTEHRVHRCGAERELAEGGSNRWMMFCASGPCGARRGAATALATMMTISAMPSHESLLHQSGQDRRRRPGCRRGYRLHSSLATHQS